MSLFINPLAEDKFVNACEATAKALLKIAQAQADIAELVRKIVSGEVQIGVERKD